MLSTHEEEGTDEEVCGFSDSFFAGREVNNVSWHTRKISKQQKGSSTSHAYCGFGGIHTANTKPSRRHALEKLDNTSKATQYFLFVLSRNIFISRPFASNFSFLGPNHTLLRELVRLRCKCAATPAAICCVLL